MKTCTCPKASIMDVLARAFGFYRDRKPVYDPESESYGYVIIWRRDK